MQCLHLTNLLVVITRLVEMLVEMMVTRMDVTKVAVMAEMLAVSVVMMAAMKVYLMAD